MEQSPSFDDLKVRVSNKQILSLALPITLAILVPQLNLLVNSIFLGHLSQEALGNAGVTGVFYLIFAVVGHGMNSSMQSVFGKYAGGGHPEKFNTVLIQGIRICLVLSGFFMLFTWILAPYLFKIIADPAAYPAEMSFLRIRILGLPFLYLFQMGNAFLIASLNSRYLIIGFLIESGVNILLDYLFIFGHGGFPAMGFNGAAWASVLAECTGMIVVFSVIRISGLKKKYSIFSRFNYNKEIFNEITIISIPLIIQYIISLSTWLVFFLLIEGRGDMAKAISNTMRNVFGLAGIFIWAFAGTCNTMVANLIGQGKKKLVLLAVQKISIWSFGFTSLIAILLNLVPSAFFNLFGQSDVFVQNGIPVIRVVSVGMLIMSLSNVWLNAVTGTGKTKINLMIEFTAIFIYLIYTFYFLKINYISLAIAWSNDIIYWSVIFLMSATFMISGKWKSGRSK
jgi:putative MATE family efflux protein